MSNTTQANSAREAAKRRRQLQVAGKNAARGVPASASAHAGGPARNAARARRRAMSVAGKAGLPQAEVQVAATAPQPEAQPQEAQPQAAVEPKASRESFVCPERNGRRSRRAKPGAQPVQASQSALRARAWRKAKAGGKKAIDAQTGQSGSAGSLAKMANPNASSRQIAKQVIADRCANGKTCNNGESERGRRMRQHFERKKGNVADAPSKVIESHTSHEQRVSGRMPGYDQRMTGTSAGQCRDVTGTEYLGTEDLKVACNVEPQRHPDKVEVTRTGGGRSVSGSTIGYSDAVSGNASGKCAQITGTEYLPADQSDLFCGTGGVDGGLMGGARPENTKRQTGVTGSDDRPAIRAEYSRGPSREARPGIMRAPTKVASSETAEGNNVTGTQPGLNRPVTGDESGYCSRVSGTPYQGVEELRERCNAEPDATPRKVTGSLTMQGQYVSGARAGQDERMTGHEAGVCSSVTGTPYFGLEQAQACQPEQVADMTSRAARRSPMQAAGVSGTAPASVGLTGAQKGVCQTVSGTAYASSDQYAAFCEETGAAAPEDPDFPVVMGATNAAAPSAPQAMASAQEASRITGAFSQGSGKVTGDDDNRSLKRQQGQARRPVGGVSAMDAGVGRVTGEGSDFGFSITGNDWNRSDQITGTEGPWANQRNQTVRGAQATAFAGAAGYRPNEGHPRPGLQISGSSGNTDVGAMVTVSGGARG